MPRGGARPGAGRPKGSKTNGATLTKNTPSRLERIKQRAKDDGKILPLDWFMGVLNDPDATDDERTEAAKAGAPYVHARAEPGQGQPDGLTHEEALLEIERRAHEGLHPTTINHDAQGGMADQPPEELLGVTGRTADQGEAV